ncbi:BON domain-containing protein [Anatilimnocola floriformis]|uniref:BON domain-containing protein n=1 Tax=Anatilimnocola floriformis TaxID=2948575 RepID=UPI0020C394CB|nr:BON domain-containing protein [Anatilimnocola floriformis]
MRRTVFRYALLAGLLISPAAAMADKAEDTQIGTTIAQKLSAEKASGGLKSFKIELQVEEGTVWMSGYVASPEQQTHALDLARRVKGVKQVVNDITISPAGSQPAQPATASKPKSAKPTEAKYAMEAGPSQARNMRASMNLPVEPAAATSPAPADPLPTIATATAKPVPMVSPIQQSPVSSVLQSRSEIGSGVAPSLAPTLPGVQQVATRPTPIQPIMPNPGYGYGPTPAPAQAYARPQVPMAAAPAYSFRQGGEYAGGYGAEAGGPMPMHTGGGMGIAPARYDHPSMPNHAWPSYAAYPNYAAVTYPKQYSPSAWPYIGPFYPYPQVPLGWRKVTMEWDDGWWMLDFKNRRYR